MTLVFQLFAGVPDVGHRVVYLPAVIEQPVRHVDRHHAPEARAPFVYVGNFGVTVQASAGGVQMSDNA